MVVLFLSCCTHVKKDYQIMPLHYPNTDRDWWPEGRSLFLDITRYYGYTKTKISADLHTKQPHTILYIHELSCVINGKKRIFLKSMKKNIPAMKKGPDGYYYEGESRELGGFFWIDELFVGPLLKDMQVNTDITVPFTQIYAFDDEPLREETVDYKIYCLEWKKEIPWFLLPND